MKLLLFIPLCLMVGCAQMSMEHRTFELTVENHSSKEVIVWLTKNGPAWEKGWKSPEDLAIESPHADERVAGVIVPAGKTAYTGKVSGSFAPDTSAILRVYCNGKKLSELLAMGHGNPNRVDVTLDPGVSKLQVRDEGPGIQVERVP